MTAKISLRDNDYTTILTFLSAKAAHEDEAFTIAGGKRPHRSLIGRCIFILKDVTEEEKAVLSSRLSMLYEKESTLILFGRLYS